MSDGVRQDARKASGLRVALVKMREALALLDDLRETLAAARLQHAIDEVEASLRRQKADGPIEDGGRSPRS